MKRTMTANISGTSFMLDEDAYRELNAYMDNGFTLIISVVRKKKGVPFNQRCEKIKWLIKHGADVDKRDCAKHYLPALSHSIQNDDFDMFKFLLHESS